MSNAFRESETMTYRNFVTFVTGFGVVADAPFVVGSNTTTNSTLITHNAILPFGGISGYVPYSGGTGTLFISKISDSGHTGINLNLTRGIIINVPNDSYLIDFQYGTLNQIDPYYNIATVDWFHRLLIDENETTSIYWNTREMTDSDGASSVQWQNRLLYDASINTSLDWQNRLLADNNSVTTLDYQNLVLSGSWKAQNLIISGQSVVTGSSNSFVTTGQTGQFYAANNPSGFILSGSSLQTWQTRSFLKVSFGNGNGGVETFLMGQVGTENDGRVYFSSLFNYSLTDPGNNYVGDGIGSGDSDYYIVPVNGIYQVTTHIRTTDGTTPSSSDARLGAGIGGAKPDELVLGNHDYPGFGWFSHGLAFRNTYCNIRTDSFTSGEHISMVTMSDRDNDYTSDGVMTVNLLSLT